MIVFSAEFREPADGVICTDAIRLNMHTAALKILPSCVFNAVSGSSLLTSGVSIVRST
jgi:hypothetical protein